MAGYGGRDIGFGERPAVLVVDFQNAVTNETQPMGQSPLVASAIPQTQELLEAARRGGAPVVFCATSFQADKQDMPPWKITAMDAWINKSWEVEIDERLWRDGDVLVIKKAPSIFFGTPVVSILTKASVDTVILAGANTSGCIRASTIDSFSYGFRTILPRECVADQGEAPHEANLRDVAIRYADVVPAADVVAYLRGVSEGRVRPPVGSSELQA
ncbi:isochorismatase family protein [Capillimicrobium parvum]|uniref:isochorismatase family protein n=1 Tax=Capillimicrobium parvum TaxID=2884022 RepID=UPI00216ABC69|nr:isochorismatase family protein [Capillimicrobium parvum]